MNKWKSNSKIEGLTTSIGEKSKHQHQINKVRLTLMSFSHASNTWICRNSA